MPQVNEMSWNLLLLFSSLFFFLSLIKFFYFLFKNKKSTLHLSPMSFSTLL